MFALISHCLRSLAVQTKRCQCLWELASAHHRQCIKSQTNLQNVHTHARAHSLESSIRHDTTTTTTSAAAVALLVIVGVVDDVVRDISDKIMKLFAKHRMVVLLWTPSKHTHARTRTQNTHAF